MIQSLIAIGIFLAAQLVAGVWWASSINTKMDFILEATRSAKTTVDAHVANDLATFSTKAEVAQALVSQDREIATALAFNTKELSAMWKQIDKLSGK